MKFGHAKYITYNNCVCITKIARENGGGERWVQVAQEREPYQPRIPIENGKPTTANRAPKARYPNRCCQCASAATISSFDTLELSSQTNGISASIERISGSSSIMPLNGT
jgi:hypothetical protein